MNLDFVTVTHMHLHISLFSTAVGDSGLLFGVVKSKRKQRGYGMLSKLDVIWVTLRMQNLCAV